MHTLMRLFLNEINLFLTLYSVKKYFDIYVLYYFDI